MAVGKGSMARASKAADNTSVSKETKRTTAKTSPACDRLPLFFLLFFSFSISLSVPIFHDYNQSELSLFLIRLYYQTLIILICQTIYFITFTQ
jgi:hypothetical protein